MPQTTVATLIDRAKSAADMRDNFVKPTEWLTWATQERLALDLFLARSGWTLAVDVFDITITGTENPRGTFPVDPDSGVMAILLVHQFDSSGRIRQLEHQDFATFLRRNPGYTGSPQGHARYYNLTWNSATLTLNMYPEPQAGETYRVIFLPHPKRLVLSVAMGQEATEEDSVNYPMGWEERVVLGMARRALIKEESSTSGIDSEIGLWDTRIEEACWSRVLTSAPGVRNVDDLHYGWSDRYTVPPFGMWTWV